MQVIDSAENKEALKRLHNDLVESVNSYHDNEYRVFRNWLVRRTTVEELIDEISHLLSAKYVLSPSIPVYICDQYGIVIREYTKEFQKEVDEKWK
ncbi:hypothetical protein [Pseudolactococcus insecticola]|uniref:Uncharacterized protein n=1 Tax=Pseudolactococcus insecticola TaxID=2709158 RepID=A0A6A0B8Q9_9LACT|nr:hypothetical protein [Lactococcus insecticola]GFH40821.1 hypothetical protein Hs20B_12190 [Lactococcus insecticola]